MTGFPYQARKGVRVFPHSSTGEISVSGGVLFEHADRIARLLERIPIQQSAHVFTDWATLVEIIDVHFLKSRDF